MPRRRQDSFEQPVNPKVTAGAVGTALAAIAVFISKKAGVDYSTEDAILITGSLGTVFSFGLGWLRKGPV